MTDQPTPTNGEKRRQDLLTELNSICDGLDTDRLPTIISYAQIEDAFQRIAQSQAIMAEQLKDMATVILKS